MQTLLTDTLTIKAWDSISEIMSSQAIPGQRDMHAHNIMG